MNYKRIYDAIITNAKLQDRNKQEGYYENHHILPKSLGGLDVEENLVLLTPKEHYIAHLLLVEIYPNNNKMIYALWCMSHVEFKNPYVDSTERQYKVGSRQYARIRESFSKTMSESKLGHTVSIETREKISETLKGRKLKPRSEQHRRRLSEAMMGKNKGRKRSKESIEKGKRTLLEKRKIDPAYGLRRSPEAVARITAPHRKRTTCPHCDKEIQYTSRNRYHFDNCKYHPDNYIPPIPKPKPYSVWKDKPIVACPHCGTEGKIGGNMKRYHFDNCKYQK